MNRFRRIEEAVVAKQDPERQVLADQVAQILLNLVRIHFVDQVRHHHHQ